MKTPTFNIPSEEVVVFAQLSISERIRLKMLLEALASIHAAANKIAKAREIALEMLGTKVRGFSAASLLRQYRTYTANGDWQCLVRRYRTIRTEGKKAIMTPKMARAFGNYFRA